jgi:ribosomal-protein-alanine N-acetyltransferase
MAKRPTSVPILDTPRCRLRPFKAADAKDLHRIIGDAETMKYWNIPMSESLVETQRWVQWLAKFSPYSHAGWAVVSKDGKTFLGFVNYHSREARDRRLEVGYALAPAHWGKGYMAEALAALVDHCFAEIKVHRIEALIDPANKASLHLVERLGFRREGGPLRDRWCVGGVYRSVLVYALLEGDKRPARRD